MPNPFDNALAHVKRSVRGSRDLPPVQLSNPATEFVDYRVEINHSRKVDEPPNEPGLQPTDDPEKQLPSKGGDDLILEDEQEGGLHCKQFAEVLKTFEDTLPDKHKTRIILHDKHNWSQVIEEASIAEMKYNKKAHKESPFGRVRGFFRSLQKRSPMMENWLGLLPADSEYGSLICGGIKIILRAAARMDEVREFMVRTLASIPDEIERAQLVIDYNQKLSTYPRLYKSVSSLYYSIFEVLTHVITWYGQKSGVRYFKVLMQQGTYEQKLEEKVGEFKIAVQAVSREGMQDFASC